MPIYEYLCPGCNGRFQRLVQGYRDPADLACPRCARRDVRRAISRVAQLRSEDARTEALADPSMLSGFDERDPQSIARWAKKLGRELGDDAGEDWNQMVDEMLEQELGTPDADEDGRPRGGTARPDDLGWA